MKQYNANGHAMPKKSDGVTKLQSDELFQDDQNLPNCTPVVFGKSGRITQSISDQKCTANVPLVYGECTGGVLKRYWKGTTEVLRRYYRGTKDIPTACTSPVYPDRKDGEGMVGVETQCIASVRNQDVPQNIIGDIRRGEISFAHSMSAKYFLPLHILLIFICCLFNNAALAQSQDTLGAVNGVDITEELAKQLFPNIKYTVDEEDFVRLKIGDSIPDLLWDLPIVLVNEQLRTDTITLRNIDDRSIIVLDFWARWCAPCVASVDKWEVYQDFFSDHIRLINVHLDYDYKAMPFAISRSWKSPTVITKSAWQLNRFFFPDYINSRIVWIVNGRLHAITGTSSSHAEDIINIVRKGESETLIPVVEGSYTNHCNREHL